MSTGEKIGIEALGYGVSTLFSRAIILCLEDDFRVEAQWDNIF